jgi:hypothetical protein
MLDDTRIRNAKLRERDLQADGLRHNGRKLWRFACRVNGKQKQIALGAYPELTPAEDRRQVTAL